VDIYQTSRFFDKTQFEEWSFALSAFRNLGFLGQLKKADNFVSIWNRPTRKRMIYSQVDRNLTSGVVRLPSTGEIFLVGSSQDDTHLNKGYRRVYNAHEAHGPATVLRKVPAVKALGELGFATTITIEATFADYELRSTDRILDTKLLGYGEYFLFLPSSSGVADLDTVTLGGKIFYVYEVYKDSGLVTCRATAKPDDRRDVLYIEVGPKVYDPLTQTVSSTERVYETTARVVPKMEQTDFESVGLESSYRIVMAQNFISYIPKVGNFVQFGGDRYKVMKVMSNTLAEEFILDIVL
jgi:hypothetical protein